MDHSPSLSHSSYPFESASLDTLHARMVANANESVLLAALIGVRLAAQRAKLEHGQWESWVESNCSFTVRTARNYIDSAERAAKALEENGNAFRFGEDPAAEPVSAESVLVYLLTVAPESDREQFIALIRKPRPALPPPPAPKPQRPPRPPVPPEKVATRYVAKIRTAPVEVRHHLFATLRDDFVAWLESQPRLPITSH